MPPEVSEEQIAAGVKSYRARCLDHGTEWRTTEPQMCPECVKDFATSKPAASVAPDAKGGKK